MCLQQLLNATFYIARKYEKQAQLSGENFNIFRILNLTTNEVRTHSAFIGELLNPKGSHGQNDSFLRHFLKTVGIVGFDTSDAEVEIEKFTGYINWEVTEGGYLDIIITNKKSQCIIIENKIYAGDQLNQLQRYHNYGKNMFPAQCHLFYLTLDGRSASADTCGTLVENEHFNTLSYQKDIIKWLELCLESATYRPLVYNTIQQYVYLIKHLTNQTTDKVMEKEVAEEMLQNGATIQAAYLIRNSVDKMEALLVNKLKEQLREVAKKLNLRYDFDPDFGEVNRETSLNFYLPGSQETMISFGFDKWRTSFYVGIWGQNINPILKNKILSSQINSIAGQTLCREDKFRNWYYLHYFLNHEISIWNNPIIYTNIQNETFAKFIEGLLEQMIAELKRVDAI